MPRLMNNGRVERAGAAVVVRERPGLLRRMALRASAALAGWRQASFWEAGEVSRATHKLAVSSRGAGSSANEQWRADGRRLAERGRYLSENNEHAAAAVDDIVRRVIGPEGIRPRFRDAELQRAWRRWARSCGLRGQSWREIQRLLVREEAAAGEAFCYWAVLNGKLVLVPVEGEYLADAYSTLGVSRSREGEQVVDGVRYDQHGRPLEYLVHEIRPLDPMALRNDPFRVPADRMAHLYRQDRPSQWRGKSKFDASAIALFDVRDSRQAELEAQRAEAYSGLHYRPDADAAPEAMDLAAMGAEVDEQGNLVIDQGPGGVQVFPGEVHSLKSQRPGGQYVPFVEHILRAIAARWGVPAWVLTGDFRGMSFAVSRMTKIQCEPTYREAQHDLIDQFCRPMVRAFLEIGSAVGLFSMPADPPSSTRTSALDAWVEETLDGVTWLRPAYPIVEPDKELEAAERRIRLGLSTWSQEVSELGRDPEEQLEAILRDRELAERHEVELPTVGMPLGEAAAEEPPAEAPEGVVEDGAQPMSEAG